MLETGQNRTGVSEPNRQNRTRPAGNRTEPNRPNAASADVKNHGFPNPWLSEQNPDKGNEERLEVGLQRCRLVQMHPKKYSNVH